ncbi:MAG: exodeoxyribonuclease III [SAR324 cluster bacterium]|nr:exodeoxyribonuclease III [SAR324 cluster bacterium]
MKIITMNLNGIRSATEKGFLEWMTSQQADVVCLQEIRVQPEQLTPAMRNPKGYESFFLSARKKGYAGVGVYFKKMPDRFHTRFGWAEMDDDGRYLQIDYGNLSIISLYLHSGSSGEIRQSLKFQAMDQLTNWLKEKRQDGREYIVCGDWNIAHQPIDLKNWKANQNYSGFLPEERQWLTMLFEELGFVDIFRKLNPHPDQYTWWSNRGQAWSKNVGWRIDYQIGTPGIAGKANHETIFREQKFSDHAPLIIGYDFEI